MWIKYNHRWAHGNGNDYYIEIPDDLEEYGYDDPTLEDRIGSYIREETNIMKDNSWSDKYRGINHFVVDHPPIDFIIKKLKSHVSNLEWHGEQVIRFRKMLDEQGYINKEEFSV